MPNHQVVSHDEWISRRKNLLQKEKAWSKLQDELTRERMKLPWEEVDKDYVFHAPHGQKSLADLFGGNSQLITYHFMLGPGWEVGCKSCSFIADHFNPSIPHLNARDVSMVAVSRAPIEEIEAFKKRMGWDFEWVSSFNNEFNFDYDVSFTEEQVEAGTGQHNYEESGFPGTEAPGVSVFYKDDENIFHTYSAYSRGLDRFIAAYHYLDIVPDGRNEEGLSAKMSWLKLHDDYQERTQ